MRSGDLEDRQPLRARQRGRKEARAFSQTADVRRTVSGRVLVAGDRDSASCENSDMAEMKPGLDDGRIVSGVGGTAGL